jgi:nucleoside-diphosphate-sugar epimerase
VRTLVMGGTRFLGIEVVEALLRAGHEVVIYHRGSRAPAWSRPVGQVLGDRTDPADLARLAALKADAISTCPRIRGPTCSMPCLASHG